MDVLIVVDMQNDFVSGALGTAEARAIVPEVVRRVADAVDRQEMIFFTRDTHGPDYLQTQEGRRLPVPHCIRGTQGWELISQLSAYAAGRRLLTSPPSAAQTSPGCCARRTSPCGRWAAAWKKSR